MIIFICKHDAKVLLDYKKYSVWIYLTWNAEFMVFPTSLLINVTGQIFCSFWQLYKTPNNCLSHVYTILLNDYMTEYNFLSLILTFKCFMFVYWQVLWVLKISFLGEFFSGYLIFMSLLHNNQQVVAWLCRRKASNDLLMHFLSGRSTVIYKTMCI